MQDCLLRLVVDIELRVFLGEPDQDLIAAIPGGGARGWGCGGDGDGDGEGDGHGDDNREGDGESDGGCQR